jgi:hypothetical protein
VPVHVCRQIDHARQIDRDRAGRRIGVQGVVVRRRGEARLELRAVDPAAGPERELRHQELRCAADHRRHGDAVGEAGQRVRGAVARQCEPEPARPDRRKGDGTNRNGVGGGDGLLRQLGDGPPVVAVVARLEHRVRWRGGAEAPWARQTDGDRRDVDRFLEELFEPNR